MARLRPVTTEYHGGANHYRIAHSVTPQAAARAAFQRVAAKEFDSAYIYDGAHTWVATVSGYQRLRKHFSVTLDVHYPRRFK